MILPCFCGEESLLPEEICPNCGRSFGELLAYRLDFAGKSGETKGGRKIVDERTKERRAKKAKGEFSLENLPEYLRERAKPGAKVYPLLKGKWVRVKGYQLFLRFIIWDTDDAWVEIVVRSHKPLLNWLLLPLARLIDLGVAVRPGQLIPDTNLFLDVWCTDADSKSGSLVVGAAAS